MSSNRTDLYQSFYNAHLRAYPNSSKQDNQKKMNLEWSAAKKDYKLSKDFDSFIKNRIKSLDLIATQNRSRSSVLSYFGKTSKISGKPESHVDDKSVDRNCEILKKDTLCTNKTVGENATEKNPLKRQYSTPAQDDTKKKIQAYESKISSLTMMKDTNLGDEKEIHRELKKARTEVQKNQTILDRKIKMAKYQKKFRENEKTKKLSKTNNPIGSNSEDNQKVNFKVGRPRKEEEFPELLQTICDIAICNSAADEPRQTEEIRTCSTLQDLTNRLQEKGIQIKKSTVYLRLLPKRSTSLEGQRHINTVPVRLCKPQNELHSQHPDGKFCTTTIKMVDALASELGQKQVAYISQDDKARVKIGMTAAYSGPTYIAIRSGKHSSSTAATHANDIESLFQLDHFDEILRMNNSETKPVLIISVDGGPRYHKTIAYAIQHFKKYALDALFIMTNAPGRSAFNRVERRMAPLSLALSGVILPYDFYGNHLDSKKECVDKELELKNFATAGETLSEIWSEMEIDKFPVLAKYITPDESLPSLPVIDYSWHQKHVRESQYFLQIVKCDDRSCCTDFRSDVRLFLHDRFFPPPLLYKRHENDGRLLIADPLKDAKNASFFTLFKRLSIKLNCNDPTFKNLPYDYHCSTVQDILQDRICPFCGLYFASLKNVKEHRKVIHPAQRIAKKILKKIATRIIKRRNDEVLCVVDNNDAQDIEWLAIEEVINADSFLPSQESEVNTEDLPIIESIKDWLKCDWEEVN